MAGRPPDGTQLDLSLLHICQVMEKISDYLDSEVASIMANIASHLRVAMGPIQVDRAD